MPDEVTDDVVENMAELSGHLSAAQEHLDKLQRAITTREVKRIGMIERLMAKFRLAE